MRRAVLGALLLILVVLGVAQLVLPGIAAQRLRDRLAAAGTVRSVHVSAFPAIELLWHHADSVRIALGAYRTGAGQVGDDLAQAGSVGRLDVTASVLDIGLLRVHDATLELRGRALRAQARVSEADLRAAVPFLLGVAPVASTGGTLTLRGTADVLGLEVSADATVAPQAGALLLTPDVPLGGLATLTLFDDPRVAVEAVSAAAAPGGFVLGVAGELR